MRSLIHQSRYAQMRKILWGLVCGLVVVGVANMGHAFLFGGGGGGGNKKNSAGQNMADLGSLFNFDFHQFGIDPKTGESGSSNSTSNQFKNYLKLPDSGTNAFASNHDAGSSFSYIGFDSYQGGNGESGNTAQNSAPVPEPATMMLLGMGLIGLAGYGRRKIKK